MLIPAAVLLNLIGTSWGGCGGQRACFRGPKGILMNYLVENLDLVYMFSKWGSLNHQHHLGTHWK